MKVNLKLKKMFQQSKTLKKQGKIKSVNDEDDTFRVKREHVKKNKKHSNDNNK